MFLYFAKRRYFLLLGCLLVAFLPFSAVQSKSLHKQVQSRYYLVPPPPPYVPSMLPEMTQYRGYGRGYYSSCGQTRAGSARTFKPNKYITYCVSNKT